MVQPHSPLLTVALVAISLSAAAFEANQSIAEPVRFQPSGFAFSVEMATSPTHERRSTSTIVGNVYTDVWSSHDRNAEFSVAITDLPSAAFWFNDEEDLIDQAHRQMIESLAAQQAGLHSVHRGPFKLAIDFVVPRDSKRGRAYFAIVDDHMVVLSAIVPSDDAERLDHYFDELRLHASTRARPN